MKIILVSVLTIFLSGCALIDAYLMAGYDGNEYALVNKIKTKSDLSIEDCKNQEKSKENADVLYFTAVEMKNYSESIPRNEESTKLAGNLVQLTKQGRDMYSKGTSVSETFCKLRLQQVSRSAEVAQKVIGKKPR
jgi:hypothetical protein